MKDSKIEWTDHTFNPWWGCVRVSPACQHCYAETFAKRVGQHVWGIDAPRRFFGEKHWNEPLKWNREAAATGERKRVFCASMADVFEQHMTAETAHQLDLQRARLWRLIDSTPDLDWLLLTKRPENIRRMVPTRWLHEPRHNVWFGTTVEDVARQERIAVLRAVPAAVRFLSCEPLLAHLDFGINGLSGIHWVIAGGESGPGARPMQPVWARYLRNRCAESGVAFHFKQWGDFNEHGVRVGKKAAGRLLDGREWNDLPAADAAVTRVGGRA